MVMPRRGESFNCARCGASVYRKRSETPKRAFCSRSCYDAERQQGATSYPKIGTRHAHRVVAELKIGRPLRPGEVVHHRDGNKANYAPSNIEVLGSQAEHARIHVPPGKRVGS
jgi:HNH endonuclease